MRGRLSAGSACQPRLRLSIQPIDGLDVGLECIDPLDSAIGPFGLDGPLVAVAQHYAKDRLVHHSGIYAAISDGSKTNALPQLRPLLTRVSPPRRFSTPEEQGQKDQPCLCDGLKPSLPPQPIR